MIKNTIAEYSAEFTYLAMVINKLTEHSVSVEMSHAGNGLFVYGYENGWRPLSAPAADLARAYFWSESLEEDLSKIQDMLLDTLVGDYSISEINKIEWGF